MVPGEAEPAPTLECRAQYLNGVWWMKGEVETSSAIARQEASTSQNADDWRREASEVQGWVRDRPVRGRASRAEGLPRVRPPADMGRWRGEERAGEAEPVRGVVVGRGHRSRAERSWGRELGQPSAAAAIDLSAAGQRRTRDGGTAVDSGGGRATNGWTRTGCSLLTTTSLQCCSVHWPLPRIAPLATTPHLIPQPTQSNTLSSHSHNLISLQVRLVSSLCRCCHCNCHHTPSPPHIL